MAKVETKSVMQLLLSLHHTKSVNKMPENKLNPG